MTKSEFIKWLEGEIAKHDENLHYSRGILIGYKVCLEMAKQLEEPKK